MPAYKEQQILDKVCKVTNTKSNTMILFLFSIFNMKKLFSIVSPPTFHLVPRSLRHVTIEQNIHNGTEVNGNGWTRK